jgi:hypothetical protein
VYLLSALVLLGTVVLIIELHPFLLWLEGGLRRWARRKR